MVDDFDSAAEAFLSQVNDVLSRAEPIRLDPIPEGLSPLAVSRASGSNPPTVDGGGGTVELVMFSGLTPPTKLIALPRTSFGGFNTYDHKYVRVAALSQELQWKIARELAALPSTNLGDLPCTES